jgi:hypothetical protein
MMAAVSCFEKFAKEKNITVSWPFPLIHVQMFINWAIIEQSYSPNTIKVYVSYLATIHRLKDLDDKNCKNFVNSVMLNGAENLTFYKENKQIQRNVMTLPLLRVLGHEISKSNWSNHSKSVIWSACTVAFFGSFRLGELLSRHDKKFNIHETLLWSDILFLEDDSAKIHNKIPKTRTLGGETISLFPFPKFSCCPIAALKQLKKFSDGNEKSPVFTFSDGSFLTNQKLNAVIRFFLNKRIGSRAQSYSCQSFRGGLPSALASKPNMENDGTIKKWGRWKSDAFERYTRLDHIAKRAMFEIFINALDDE